MIPTVGRPALLRACVASVLACDPAPGEVVLVDQSPGGDVADILSGAAGPPVEVRVVRSGGRGIATATNEGIRAARRPAVLVTHDDCVVARDWVGRAVALAERHPSAILTGRVLAPRDAGYVPSTIDGPDPVDYTGQLTSGVLYPANMVCDRESFLEFGGFDERPGFRLAAEDNDLCYRWLRSARALRYEPELVVWHHDWRSPAQLRRTHQVYAQGQAAFYAKHLVARDAHILPLLRWDLLAALRAQVRAARRQVPRWQDPYREMLRALTFGVAVELWRARPGRG